jgi:hypothetical protein
MRRTSHQLSVGVLCDDISRRQACMKLIGTGDKLMDLSAQGCIKRVGEVSILLHLLLSSYNCKGMHFL